MTTMNNMTVEQVIEAIQTKLNNRSIVQVKKIAELLYDNASDEADIVFEQVLNNLHSRMTSEGFIEFCNTLYEM